MISSTTTNILRAVISELQTPVVAVLLVLMAVTVVMTGSFICEFFTEHRKLSEKIPELIERINRAEFSELPGLIEESGLLKRQKAAVRKLLQEQSMTRTSREAYAAQLLFDEEEHYHRYIRWPEAILRLGPMFGLLGTLIPLGPGLMALGKGDTMALSKSLLVAFDTTAAGVIIAAVAFVIFQIRRHWYRYYAQGLESVMEVILEKEEPEVAHAER